MSILGIKLLLKQLTKDIFSQDTSLGEKLWAYKRGFLSMRVKTYGITEANYRDHIPDFDYYRLHPLNGQYTTWIDDKLIIKYLLAPFDQYLPRYYFLLNRNELARMMDCPDDIAPDVDGVIELLKREGNLAVKLIAGSLGKGFFRLTYEDSAFYVNMNLVTLPELRDLVGRLEGYLITEYVLAHPTLKAIYGATPNTVRVQLIRNSGNEPATIMGSLIRFGTKQSGVLETPSAGGIFAGVNHENGNIYRPYYISNNRLISIKFHPDTNEDLEINLPGWHHLIKTLQDISDYLPQISYVGFDIIMTDNSFKIIELNSLTSPTVLSYYYPFLLEENAARYFFGKFKAAPKLFKRILKDAKNR